MTFKIIRPRNWIQNYFYLVNVNTEHTHTHRENSYFILVILTKKWTGSGEEFQNEMFLLLQWYQRNIQRKSLRDRSTFESHRICNVYRTHEKEVYNVVSEGAVKVLIIILIFWQNDNNFFSFLSLSVEENNDEWKLNIQKMYGWKKACREAMLKNVTAKVISLLCRRRHSIAIIKKWRRTEWKNKKQAALFHADESQNKLKSMVWALMRYIVVKIPNEIIMYHLIAVWVWMCCFFFIFLNSNAFFGANNFNAISVVRLRTPKPANKITSQRNRNGEKKIEMEEKHERKSQEYMAMRSLFFLV